MAIFTIGKWLHYTLPPRGEQSLPLAACSQMWWGHIHCQCGNSVEREIQFCVCLTATLLNPLPLCLQVTHIFLKIPTSQHMLISPESFVSILWICQHIQFSILLTNVLGLLFIFCHKVILYFCVLTGCWLYCYSPSNLKIPL